MVRYADISNIIWENDVILSRMYDEIRQDWASSSVTLGFLFLELLKRYINRLPTLTQLPTGNKERWNDQVVVRIECHH